MPTNFDPPHLFILDVAKEKILSKMPHVISLYVFGSFGTKYERRDSDLDLAVYSNEKMDSVDLWYLAQEIAVELGRDVDLVDLSSASTIFKYQILGKGNRFFCKDTRKSDFVENLYMSMYLKFKDDQASWMMS